MARGRVRIIPLGGVGEIGKNTMLVESGEDLVLIDCGLMFPGEDMPGVDLVIPDLSYLRGKEDRLRGILITHGHEDHIGALPYILPQLGRKLPIYATRLTHGLIEVKLREYGLEDCCEPIVMEPGDTISLGHLKVEPYQVSHSIPDGAGLALHTPAGIIVHSGDFKFDYSPVDGRATDVAKLAELGQRGVLALLCDCVRVESPGHTPSERTLNDSFDYIFATAPGRIIVATFASNISRLQQVVDTAYRHQRQVAIAGRSMENNAAMAMELGYLDVPEGLMVRPEEAVRLPPAQVAFVTTGSQGEPTSVLSRIANRDHRLLRLVPGDTVVISATPVPGHEEAVGRTINNLLKLGAEVIYNAVMPVHVSGHASQEDLKLMLNLLRPRYCVPIHGEYRHMVLFRRLAMEVGLEASQVLLAGVGRILEFGKGFGGLAGKVPAGSVLVDGLTVGDVGRVVLRDRRLLARDGILMVAVVVDKQTGRPLAEPEIVARGFIYDQETLIQGARELVRRELEQGDEVGAEYGFISQKIHEALSDYIYEQTRRRPMILPVVTEI